jgi:hypothetical protein
LSGATVEICGCQQHGLYELDLNFSKFFPKEIPKTGLLVESLFAGVRQPVTRIGRRVIGGHFVISRNPHSPGPRLIDVSNVGDAQLRMPETRPQLIAEAQWLR